MYKVGDKVIPHTKTVPGWDDLETSHHWGKAKSIHQPYLYVTGFDEDDPDVLILNHMFVEDTGDFYYPEDVELYVDWNIQFLETRDELKKKHYRIIIDWLELHESDFGKIEIAKVKNEALKENLGCFYMIRLTNEAAIKWAEKEWMKKETLKRRRDGIYCSKFLDALLEFGEESKKKVS